MKILAEYVLDKKEVAEQTLYLSKKTDVVNILVTESSLFLLALTDPLETNTELRTFKVCSTFEKIYDDLVIYIGSFKGELGTMHVVEIVKESLI